MRNALWVALLLQVRNAEQQEKAAEARMQEALARVREQRDPQDLEQAQQLDVAARELERARAYAGGVKATCDYLTRDVLGETPEGTIER